MRQFEIIQQDTVDEFKREGYAPSVRGKLTAGEAIEAAEKRVTYGGTVYVCEVQYRIVAVVKGVHTTKVEIIEVE